MDTNQKNKLSNSQAKKKAAAAHNARYLMLSDGDKARSQARVIKPAAPSVRHAGIDNTSKHGSKENGRKMRAKVDKKLDQIMRGRKKIDLLMSLANIQTNL